MAESGIGSFAIGSAPIGSGTAAAGVTAVQDIRADYLGRFAPVKFIALPLLRQNEARDVAAAAPQAGQSESNIFVINYRWESAPPQFRYLYSMVPAQDVPAAAAQAETNTGFLGRFTAPKYSRLPYSQPIEAVYETNVSFLGRFTAPKHSLLPPLRQNADTGVQAETNTSFLGRFTAPRYARFNYNTQGSDVAVAPAQPETNPHFIGRFVAVSYRNLPPLRQQPAGDFVSAPAGPVFPSESNIFVINYRWEAAPAQLRSLYLQAPALDVPAVGPVQADTAVSFLGQFTPSQHSLLGSLRQSSAEPPVTDFPGSSFIGRFAVPRYQLLPSLRQNPAGDFVAAAPVTAGDAPSNIFVVNYRWWSAPEQIRALYLQQPASDFAIAAPQAETNTHFIGRHRTTAYTILLSLRQNAATDFVTAAPQAETSVSFLARYRTPSYAILLSLRQNPATDFVTAAPQAETNPHFLGKFTPNQIRILPGLRQNAATDFIIGPPVVPPGAGGELRYRWRWCDFTDRLWFKAFCEEFYRLKALRNPERRRRQLADLEQALDLAIERAAGGFGEPEWTFDIRAAGGMLQDELGAGGFDRIAAGLARLALEIDDEEAFLLLGD